MPTFLSQINWARALYVIGTVLGLATLLSWLQPLILPLVLATLATFVLAPAVASIEQRLKLRAVAVAIVVAVAFTAIAAIAWLLGKQFTAIVDGLPRYEYQLRQKVAAFYLSEGIVDKLNRAAQRLRGEIERTEADQETATPPATLVRIAPDESIVSVRAAWGALTPLLKPLGEVALAGVLIIFFLLRREDLRDRVLTVIGVDHLAPATKALDDAGERISAYLLRQFYVNAGFGLVVGIGLFVLGVPHAAMFGFIAGVLRYLPYIGPIAAAALPVIMTLLVYDGWNHLLLVAAFLLFAELVTNMVVEPWVYGRGIGLSETATVLMVAFWTWLWGPLGLLVGTPLTVCLVVLGRHVPALKFFDTMLGDSPALEPHLGLYQRVLAGRIDEATDLLQAKGEPAVAPSAVFDGLLLPAMARANSDARAGVIDNDQLSTFTAGVRTLVDELKESEPPETVAQEGRDLRGASLLAAPCRNEINSVALSLLEVSLASRGITINEMSRMSLVADVVRVVGERDAKAILISAFAPGGVAQAKLLCLRLRSRYPGLRIIVGRWAATPESDADARQQLADAGANDIVVSIADARNAICNTLALAAPTADVTSPSEERKP